MTNQLPSPPDPCVWALKFSLKVSSIRYDIPCYESYETGMMYVDNLPSIIYEDPEEVAFYYLESSV